MSPTVRERISEQESELVGRERERAILGELLVGTVPLVLFVHGMAGVGKSALVGHFAAQARAGGAIVLRLDCGDVEPTQRGFLAALSTAIGGDLLTLDDALVRLASLGERVVLALDRCEVLRPLDP